MTDPTVKRGPSNEVPALGYDPTTTHAMVPLQVVSIAQDPITGQYYGVLNVNASFSASSLAINDPTTTSQKAAVDASGNLHTALFNGVNQLAIDASGRLTILNLTQIGGQAPKLDNTNVLGVSLYGKNAAAGDTPLLLDASGRPIIGNIVQIGGQNVKLDNTNEQAVSIYGKGSGAAGDTPFLLDSSGRLMVNIAQVGGVSTQMSNSDGVNPANIPAESLYIYDSGGPVDITGKPTQLAFARAKTWLGSATNTGTITSTVQGDTALVFSVAPKTIMPGQKIRLTGATTEYVIVSSSYTPSSTATSIPLAAAVVQAGNVTATWDVFSTSGAGTNAVLPDSLVLGGIPLSYDPASGNVYAANAATADAVNPRYLPEVVPGLYNGSSTADRWRGDNTGAARVSLYGKNSSAGDTALLLDALGQMTIEQFIQYQIMQGHGFRATTGFIATGTGSNNYVGIQGIVSGISKNALFYVISGVSGSGAASQDARLYTNNVNTADSALTTNLLTSIKNQQPGSVTTSALSALWGSPASTTQTGSFVGTLVEQDAVVANAVYNACADASFVWFKAGDTGSFAFYVRVTATTNQAACNVKWIEW